MRGTVAFAPPSHVDVQLTALRAVPRPLGTATFALLLRALDETYPDLAVRPLLTARARALYPQTLVLCQRELTQPDSYGGLNFSELLKPTADTHAVLRRIRQNSVERITPTSRVMLLQGLADTTVVAPSTTPLGTTYQAAGVNLVFRTYPRSTHASVALDGAADATRFLARVLATR